MFSKLFKRKEDAAAPEPGVSIFPDGDQVMLSEGSTGDAVVAPSESTLATSNAYMEQLVEGNVSGDDPITLPVLELLRRPSTRKPCWRS